MFRIFFDLLRNFLMSSRAITELRRTSERMSREWYIHQIDQNNEFIVNFGTDNFFLRDGGIDAKIVRDFRGIRD